MGSLSWNDGANASVVWASSASNTLTARRDGIMASDIIEETRSLTMEMYLVCQHFQLRAFSEVAASSEFTL